MAHLRHLAIRCRDMQRSRDFYETNFGWKFIGYRPSVLGLDLSDGVNNITILQPLTPEMLKTWNRPVAVFVTRFFPPSVVQGTALEALSEGQTVEFESESGQKGPKVTTVKTV